MTAKDSLHAVSDAVQRAAHAALLCVYQIAWLVDRSRVKVWEKSRRIGASWIEALYTVLEAAKKISEGGQNTYYLSYNKDMTRQFVKDCAWWAKVLGVVCGDVEEIIDDYDKNVTIFRIRFASGCEVEALPSEARSLRSKKGRVVLDEAAFVDDLAALLKAALALLMWGGQVVILSSHNGDENPFNELLADVRAGKLPYTLHRTDLDDALEGGLYKAICRKLGQPWTPEGQEQWRADIITEYGDGADEELYCVPKRSTGTWLSGALIEGCMAERAEDVPVLRWRPPVAEFVDVPLPQAEAMVAEWLAEHVAPLLALLPKDRSHYVGVDFGRTGDLSVFWVLTEQVDLTLGTPFALELRTAPFRTQEQILTYLINGLPNWGGVSLDARGNGQALAEYARQTWGPAMVAEVMLTEGWYREHMPRLKSRLEDRTLLLPRDADTKDDLRSLRMVRGVPRVPDTRNKGGSGQRHADSAVALVLALHAQATLGVQEEWEVETVGRDSPVEGWDRWR